MAIEVTDANFDATVLKNTLPVLVDFWAPWCGPCRAVSPIVEEISKELDGKVAVCKVNVDENQASPSRFGIRAIPTLIVFKDGEVVDQITGAVAKNNIMDLINKAL